MGKKLVGTLVVVIIILSVGLLARQHFAHNIGLKSQHKLILPQQFVNNISSPSPSIPQRPLGEPNNLTEPLATPPPPILLPVSQHKQLATTQELAINYSEELNQFLILAQLKASSGIGSLAEARSILNNAQSLNQYLHPQNELGRMIIKVDQELAQLEKDGSQQLTMLQELCPKISHIHLASSVPNSLSNLDQANINNKKILQRLLIQLKNLFIISKPDSEPYLSHLARQYLVNAELTCGLSITSLINSNFTQYRHNLILIDSNLDHTLTLVNNKSIQNIHADLAKIINLPNPHTPYFQPLISLAGAYTDHAKTQQPLDQYANHGTNGDS